MQNGIIKNYNTKKGYGFIEVKDQKEDVFFHISTWQSPSEPSAGTAVRFDSERNHKGLTTLWVTPEDALQGHTTQNKPKHHNTQQHNQQQTRHTQNATTHKVKKSWLSSIISALVILAAVFFGGSELLSGSHSNTDSASSSSHTVSASHDIPVITGDAQIDKTIALIQQGGPYPYPEKDGTTFYNREGQLPKQSRGYYREYTVPTPGVSHRGPRRIVTGGNPPTYYYLTVDHYDSFTKLEVQ